MADAVASGLAFFLAISARRWQLLGKMGAHEHITRDVLTRAFACDTTLADVISAQARFQDHPQHSVIVESERVFTHVYVLIDGRARMVAYAVDGRLVAVEDYDIGDFIGEHGLFETHTAPHDIVASTAARTAAFAHPQFLALMTNYQCIALAVSRRLVARLSHITRRMVEGATLSANGRIHAELLRQAKAGENMTIAPPPVLSAFALLVQSTRETVSRAISNLEKRGIILRDEHQLRIVAPHRLEELIF